MTAWHGVNSGADVFCWCGRQMMRVAWAVIERGETVECSRDCKVTFDRRGVLFEGEKFCRGCRERFVCGHKSALYCSVVCRDKARQVRDVDRWKRRAS